MRPWRRSFRRPMSHYLAERRGIRSAGASPPPPGEEVHDRHEKGGADDGPQDRKRMPADRHHEGLRKLEEPSDPRPEQGPDEDEGDRDDEAAPHAARDRLPDGAANGRDHDEKQKRRQ